MVAPSICALGKFPEWRAGSHRAVLEKRTFLSQNSRIFEGAFSPLFKMISGFGFGFNGGLSRCVVTE
ncbi:MAG: hypothetical protein DMG50_12725 [Acidobacteria bacterium]|nr:MAG: hypothetical protein DMG50_12725 [Acidobacteriota bacterium]